MNLNVCGVFFFGFVCTPGSRGKYSKCHRSAADQEHDSVTDSEEERKTQNKIKTNSKSLRSNVLSSPAKCQELVSGLPPISCERKGGGGAGSGGGGAWPDRDTPTHQPTLPSLALEALHCPLLVVVTLVYQT